MHAKVSGHLAVGLLKNQSLALIADSNKQIVVRSHEGLYEVLCKYPLRPHKTFFG